jgi:hypothetical protein
LKFSVKTFTALMIWILIFLQGLTNMLHIKFKQLCSEFWCLNFDSSNVCPALFYKISQNGICNRFCIKSYLIWQWCSVQNDMVPYDQIFILILGLTYTDSTAFMSYAQWDAFHNSSTTKIALNYTRKIDKMWIWTSSYVG